MKASICCALIGAVLASGGMSVTSDWRPWVVLLLTAIASTR